MRSVLAAIDQSSKLKLQIVVTGMHLDRRLGHSISRIGESGRKIDTVVPWKGKTLAEATGNAIAGLAKAFQKLRPDVVILVGDRVEGLAAAVAAHLNGILVAHVHGGDRALGQVDDSLRHAITKLAHIHFPATTESAKRVEKLGEEKSRIFCVGSPGLDGIRHEAASARTISADFPELKSGRFALLALHPADADERIEYGRACTVLHAILDSDIDRVVVVYPNNDPGNRGIIRCWEQCASDSRLIVRKDISRNLFLGLLRDCAFLIGNSSAGIIEAASFSTPAIDVGPRQLGRQRCENVLNVPYRQSSITAAIKRVLKSKRPRRIKNVYEGKQAGRKIAQILAKLSINPQLLRKLIVY
jgi:UDP-N-acetylglucosamine 2-epimerase (non-hydrolysing)/GDP/UDP-N,N'-diacetylbacillosamine 2-epimerase (hydrolysing)